MSLEFGFYDSYNGDRKYNAQQMNSIFDGVLNDGVYASVGEKFAVTPGTGLQVIVGTGRAWFKATWNHNAAPIPLDLDQPDPVYSRIDAVVLKVDKRDSSRSNSIEVFKGSVMLNPTPPLFPSAEDVFYLPLAYITVKANASRITAAEIEILVGKSQCPYVTSILQQTNIDVLFSNWNQQFMDWWANVKDILNDETVGKLTNLIEQRVKVSDLATDDEAKAGSSNEKWMSPAKVKVAIAHQTSPDTHEVGYIFCDPTLTSPPAGCARCDGSFIEADKYPEYVKKVGLKYAIPCWLYDDENIGKFKVITNGYNGYLGLKTYGIGGNSILAGDPVSDGRYIRTNSKGGCFGCGFPGIFYSQINSEKIASITLLAGDKSVVNVAPNNNSASNAFQNIGRQWLDYTKTEAMPIGIIYMENITFTNPPSVTRGYFGAYITYFYIGNVLYIGVVPPLRRSGYITDGGYNYYKNMGNMRFDMLNGYFYTKNPSDPSDARLYFIFGVKSSDSSTNGTLYYAEISNFLTPNGGSEILANLSFNTVSLGEYRTSYRPVMIFDTVFYKNGSGVYTSRKLPTVDMSTPSFTIPEETYNIIHKYRFRIKDKVPVVLAIEDLKMPTKIFKFSAEGSVVRTTQYSVINNIENDMYKLNTYYSLYQNQSATDNYNKAFSGLLVDLDDTGKYIVAAAYQINPGKTAQVFSQQFKFFYGVSDSDNKIQVRYAREIHGGIFGKTIPAYSEIEWIKVSQLFAANDDAQFGSLTSSWYSDLDLSFGLHLVPCSIAISGGSSDTTPSFMYGNVNTIYGITMAGLIPSPTNIHTPTTAPFKLPLPNISPNGDFDKNTPYFIKIQ